MAAIVKNPRLTAATIRLYNKRNALTLYGPSLLVRFAKHLRCKFYDLCILIIYMHRRCLAERAGEDGANIARSTLYR